MIINLQSRAIVISLIIFIGICKCFLCRSEEVPEEYGGELFPSSEFTDDYDDYTFPEMDTVVTFLDEFETLSASTADVGQFLEKLSWQSYAFLKLAFPVGSLIAGALQIATKYIYIHTVKFCATGLEENKIAMLSKLLSLMRKIRAKMDSTFERQQFDTKLGSFYTWIIELEASEAETILYNLKGMINSMSSFASADEATNAIREIFSSDGLNQEINSMCLLQDIIVGKSFHFKAVDELENIIRLDMIQLITFGSICANLTFSGDGSRMDWYQREILWRVQNISSHLQAYIPKEMEKSFPSIKIETAKTTIDSLNLVLPVTQNTTVDKAAAELNIALAEIGSRNYVLQVLVVTNLAKNDDFFAICPKSSCFLLLDYQTMHIMVTRVHKYSEVDRFIDAHDWLNEPRSTGYSLQYLIWEIISDQFNIGQVSLLKQKIESGLRIQLTNDAYYKSFVILRGYGDLCIVKKQLFTYKIEAYPAYGLVYYYFVGSFWHSCEEFTLYFFA